METKPEDSSKHEIVVDSDWISTAGMALVILLTLVIAIADVKSVLQGRTKPVSYSTVILAVYMIFLAVQPRLGRLFRVGAAALGIGATIRAIAYYLGLSSDIQQSAGINQLVFSIFACVVIFVATAQWFRDVVKVQKR